MEATALVTREDQTFSLETVLLPALGKNDILVKTAYSGVSIGTEFALIRNKISWGPYPLVTGYMSTGTVEAIGEAVTEVQPGDKVFVRNSVGTHLKDGTALSAVAGTHCSHIITQAGGTHGLGILPDACSMETASMFVMPAVGYYGVSMSQPELGELVVVYGCGLIGLGVIAAAAMRGCKVVAIDIEDSSLERARGFGADWTLNARQENLPQAIEALQAGGADVVFECTGIPAMLNPAIELCRTDGKFIWQGNYGSEPVSLAFLPAHNRRLKMFFPCDDGYMPSRMAVLKHMASGLLPWDTTITHRIGMEAAPAVYQSILDGDKSYAGVTIQWS